MTQSPVIFTVPKRLPQPQPRQVIDILREGWKWLASKRAQQLTARRLRVTETVSLGEKRSVAIIKVDGVEMLIGLSGSSVSLLTVIKPKRTPRKKPRPVAELSS